MAEQSTMTLDAQIVRRFLAKAYGEEHPAMEAFYNVWRASQHNMIRSLSRGRHPADASHLPRKTTHADCEDTGVDMVMWWDKFGTFHIDSPCCRRVMHGDFGAMEFTTPKDLNQSTTTTTE